MSFDTSSQSAVSREDRPRLDTDIVCVGFGPASAGFLTTLARKILGENGTVRFESVASPGQPLQVICYERADDICFGVSGLVTRARSLRETFPGIESAEIPMATPVTLEKVVYLFDPIGCSRRSKALRFVEQTLRAVGRLGFVRDHALELPWTPSFLHKTGGIVFSLGQLMQWVGAQLLNMGVAQIWPGSPVAELVFEGDKVVGVRLADQGVDKHGQPMDGYSRGIEIHAALTVVADGPTGQIGQQLTERFGMPPGHKLSDWAVGMKAVVDLPADSRLQPGTVIHTLGFPEPEIFGFLYVHPNGLASLGIFVPSWFSSPVRTAYRYMQHWMLHPYLWKHLSGSKIRSWGAKTICESGRLGEPYLVGDGWARIGEGSGSTNVLTGSGVDEAWATGVMLAEAVVELLEKKLPFDRTNLENAYVKRRRASWVEREAVVATHARDGFRRGFIRGLLGMAMAGLSNGRFCIKSVPVTPSDTVLSLEDYCRGRIPGAELSRIRERCRSECRPLHDLVMERLGWPPIQLDGQLLVSHQDALLIGGKVHAPSGYANHVVFLDPGVCRKCDKQVCIEMCSGQAIAPGPDGGPVFDREKCVHCGACLWNCVGHVHGRPDKTNIEFRAGPGGLHSGEN
ncbi:MAG: 4Fe-4S ferredoxin [Verrucomicrobiae bacterium]|nr:4Fe-4S ferredoxin [Verrucomicrobiae bacterium]